MCNGHIERRGEKRKTFKEIMAENVPNLKRESINLHKKIINIGKHLENLELFHNAGGNANGAATKEAE